LEICDKASSVVSAKLWVRIVAKKVFLPQV
jgi:hypothetical protein